MRSRRGERMPTGAQVEALTALLPAGGGTISTALDDSTSALKLALGLATAGVIWIVVVTNLGTSVYLWLSGHLVMLAGGVLVTTYSARDGWDVTGDIMVLLATLVLGPAGAAIAGSAVLAATRMRFDTVTLAAWYQRISDAGDVDRVTRLATAVALGRSVQIDSPVPQSFASVIADGSIAQRQNALGLIARRFAPPYACALRAALVSSEPVVRVQAAAVAVKVKAELAGVLDALSNVGVGTEPSRAIEAAAELDAMISTGLLDAADVERARAGMTSVLDRVLADFPLDGASMAAFGDGVLVFEEALPSWLETASYEARHLIETELLRQRRFSAFRALRARGATTAANAAISASFVPTIASFVPVRLSE